MALPVGLVPAFVFALTAGVATIVTLGAHLLWRGRPLSFSAALGSAFLAVGVAYLGGTVAVWAVAGGGALWEVAVTLLVAGAAAAVVFWLFPLFVGQRLVQALRGTDSETALRFATYGWPVAMLAVAGIFVAPGGIARGHLLHLDGAQTCLAGFCGISISVAVAVGVELLVALVGPGLVGFGLHASRTSTLSLGGG